MSMTPPILFSGLVIWALVALALNFKRRYGWANNARITAGGLIVLAVLALGEATVGFFEAKVLLSAVGGGIMVRGFERERVKPETTNV